MLSNSRQVEIEFGDCDPAGIVYYPNYFRMFDASTAHLFEAALGMKKIAWIKRFGILGIPMVDTGARFIKPSRFGDVVTITSTVTRVWVGTDPDDPQKLKSMPVPEEVVAAFSRDQP